MLENVVAVDAAIRNVAEVYFFLVRIQVNQAESSISILPIMLRTQWRSDFDDSVLGCKFQYIISSFISLEIRCFHSL